jgi:hypothetical protein
LHGRAPSRPPELAAPLATWGTPGPELAEPPALAAPLATWGTRGRSWPSRPPWPALAAVLAGWRSSGRSGAPERGPAAGPDH